MHQNETVVRPFPPSFVFQDVEQHILECEESPAPKPSQVTVWRNYMTKVLTPESAAAERR